MRHLIRSKTRVNIRNARYRSSFWPLIPDVCCGWWLSQFSSISSWTTFYTFISLKLWKYSCLKFQKNWTSWLIFNSYQLFGRGFCYVIFPDQIVWTRSLYTNIVCYMLCAVTSHNVSTWESCSNKDVPFFRADLQGCEVKCLC